MAGVRFRPSRSFRWVVGWWLWPCGNGLLFLLRGGQEPAPLGCGYYLANERLLSVDAGPMPSRSSVWLRGFRWPVWGLLRWQQPQLAPHRPSDCLQTTRLLLC